MIQIYHNPRCSKSRAGLNYLEEKGLDYEIIRYLDTPLTAEEIRSLLKKLNYTPIELVRTNEAIWKSDYKNRSCSDEEIIEAMVLHPKLIERPIFVKGNRAVVGRPTERIEEIL